MKIRLFIAPIAICFSLQSPPVMADSVSSRTIVEALKLDNAPPGARSFRGVSSDEDENSIKKIDLRIQFEYNEAVLTDEATLTLNALAEALKSEDLAELKFKIIGHTDARGTDEYNQALSENRASAVVSYLTSKHGINSSRLLSSGEGEQRLFIPSSPESSENRRVEIQTILKQK